MSTAGTPLGDPIEVGALGTALGQRGASRLVALGSSKSCFGHTEGSAGLTGVLLAATGLRHQRLCPIVNLRELNPYVSAALADWRTMQGIAAAGSRLLTGAAHLGAAQALAGASSFGMSGVNAHALLSAAAADAAGCAAPGPDLAWQRGAYWPAPIPHPLLLAAAVGHQAAGSARAFEFSLDLASSRLTWLRDHGVQGTLLLPAAAMFEMAAAAAAAPLYNDGSVAAGGSSLVQLAILAPRVLSADSQAGAGSVLRCSLAASTGGVEVQSGSGARHLQATTSAGPALLRRLGGSSISAGGMPLPFAGSSGMARSAMLAALLQSQAEHIGIGHNLGTVESRGCEARDG